MASFGFLLRIFFVICCLVFVTSYKIDHRPSFDDRNDRAVTEWRFRRNYLFQFPYFSRNHFKNNDRNEMDQMKSMHKKHSSFP